MKQIANTQQSSAVGAIQGSSNQVFLLGRVQRRPDGDVTLESGGQTYRLTIRPTDPELTEAFSAVGRGDVFERAQIWGELSTCGEPKQVVVGKVALGERKQPSESPVVETLTPWGRSMRLIHGPDGKVRLPDGGQVLDPLQVRRLQRAPQNVSFQIGPGGRLYPTYF